MGRKAYERFTCECGIVCEMVPHEKSGKLAPITKDTYDDGNIEFLDDMFGSRTYRIVPKAERESIHQQRHLNHWSNCTSQSFTRKAQG